MQSARKGCSAMSKLRNVQDIRGERHKASPSPLNVNRCPIRLLSRIAQGEELQACHPGFGFFGRGCGWLGSGLLLGAIGGLGQRWQVIELRKTDGRHGHGVQRARAGLHISRWGEYECWDGGDRGRCQRDSGARRRRAIRNGGRETATVWSLL